MEQGKLIILEFNELCPDLMRRWMDQGLLPNFRRMYDSSQIFTVQAETEEAAWLEPWIQWFSMHTGLACQQHGVQHLTDGPRTAGKITDIWHALLAAGLRVGNGGSMNAAGFRAPGSFFLPDPWCTTEPPFPETLEAYHRVVLAKVQEGNSGREAITAKDYLNFLKFLSAHGLSSRSVLAMVGQLTREKRDSTIKWKRAALLDQLQRDVFFHYWRRTRPDFSTFFLNSTAHFQHSYFHLASPEKFDLPAAAFGDEAHRDTVLFGFQRMDRLVGEFMTLEAQGARLAFVTALSQQPWEGAGMAYYRPRDMEALLTRIGIHPNTLQPVMAQQYAATFDSIEDAGAARLRLDAVQFESKPLFKFDPSEPGTLFFGIGRRAPVGQDAMVSVPDNARPQVPFADLVYQLPETKMTLHHPRSMFWLKTGRHTVHEKPVSILDIFPTLLDYYGVDMPGDRGFSRQGASLLAETGMERYRPSPASMVA